MQSLLFVGFASGLPILLISKTLQSWMSDAGTDLNKIGWYSGLIGLPYAFKFLWAPLLDRFVPPFLGRRKGWLIIIQFLLVLSIGAMFFQDPKRSLNSLAINALLIAFLGASQDIVADAYRTDVLSFPEKSIGMGCFTAGYRVALILSFAGASRLSSQVFHAWQPVYLAMAGFMFLGLVYTWFVPGTEATDSPPATLTDAVVLPFLDFFQRQGVIYGLAVLLFIILYKLSDAMMNAMSIPFLKAACFRQEQISDISGVMGMIATIVGALLGGVLLLPSRRMRVVQGLWIFGGLQALGIIFYFFLAQAINPNPAVTNLIVACQNFVAPPFANQLFILAINIENFFGGMESSAFGMFLMNMCNKRFSATQLALLSSLMAFSRMLVSPAGQIIQLIGWPNFFLLSMIIILPSLVLLVFIDRLTPQEKLTSELLD
jgi:MFS transporter, PAT family, beta-lactamase induction signal transducer AmpG